MWKHTLNLPRPALAPRSSPARTAELLPRVTTQLYAAQRARGGPPRVLHDGPPYANGALHMGHALNKILKDVLNRARVLAGHAVQYAPGWDCHGLPIELRALKDVPPARLAALSAQEKRARARALAARMAALQRAEFEQFAVMTDWDAAYYTMRADFVARELRLFRTLVQRRLVSRQLRPVFWSPQSRTALAEAELVYADRTDTACYVAYDAPTLGAALLVWTTTPWTLVGNAAVAVHADLPYVEARAGQRSFVVARDAVPNLRAVLPDLEAVRAVPTAELLAAEYVCPLRGSRHRVVHGSHVTADGTGLVHTAPAHGKEDYLVGQQHGLPVESVVDAAGRYVRDFGLGLAGLDARREGTAAVLAALGPHCVHTHQYTHSVPLDWRSKCPVVVRATPQFFIDLGPLKPRALRALADVEFVPAAGRARLEAFVKTRSEWCISRQRCWGVPIPVFLDKATGAALLDDDAIAFAVDRVNSEGPDAWFSISDVAAWLPPRLRARAAELEPCTDTLDVWLDSGSSFLALDRTPADTYLEGSDQHRGWFQSSLLLHAAEHEHAPFRQLVTHGFVLDAEKQKMSKSLGNVVSPHALIGKIGIDGLRLLVAQSDYTSDLSLNVQSIEGAAALLKKLRLTFRFLLANTQDYADADLAERPAALSLLDKHVLHSLAQLSAAFMESYARLDFQNAVRQLQVHLNSLLSAVYFDAVKDVLYADAVDSPRRRAVQLVLLHTLAAYTRLLAPLAPLLTQEVWDVCPVSVTQRVESPLLAGVPALPTVDEPALRSVPRLLEIRSLINECVERAKRDKVVTSALTCDVYIEDASSESGPEFPAELLETVCVASKVHLAPPPAATPYTLERDGVRISVTKPSMPKCERCWKHTAREASEHTLCARCAAVVA